MSVDAVPAGKNWIYFAFVNYPTLGYGDITPVENWQLLGPITAMNGVRLFGCSAGRLPSFRCAAQDNAVRFGRSAGWKSVGFRIGLKPALWHERREAIALFGGAAARGRLPRVSPWLHKFYYIFQSVIGRPIRRARIAAAGGWRSGTVANPRTP
jgi:hypothetical protein